ncbi:helix-turn-helix transcriptional regulator [Micromonospora aurantiaca]|uniref:LuxR C-terminal-related transcriptional regulator n=1 Tax=Micromonospora aurantiaca (nom. illeg.) TaxID=47850 RepID=UPI0016573C7F|nr:helix-turn-helix transcriptional regulator [Micromonospora aurantiaca]MBC9006010.1 helix-turn-helix transcriptional regulator [Micromonospora aurantiaca]
MSQLPETPLTNRPKMHTGVPSSLTTAQRWVLRGVAVADAPCGLWFLEAVAVRTGTTPDEPVDATVEELIARGFLVDTAAGLRLASIALRDDVLRDTPASVRQALREAAAEVLADAGRPAQAARQLLRVLPAVSRSARALATRLAADPAVGPSLAADLLLAAPAPGPADERLAWLVDVADNLYLAGRVDETLRMLHREVAADRYGPRQRAMLLGRLGAYYATQRPSLSLTYLGRALNQELDAAGRSWTLTMLASLAARFGHPDAAELVAAAERAHERSPSPGGGIRLALANASRATVTGDLPRAARILREVDAGEPAARTQAIFLRVDRVANQIALGRYVDAATALDGVAGEIDTLGAVAQPLVTALDCVLRLSTGELAEAEARARARLALTGRGGALPAQARVDLLATVVEVLLRRGEVAAARELLADERPVVGWPDDMQWFRLGCAAAGDPEPGLHAALLGAAFAMPDRSMAPLLLVPHHGPRLVRAALALGDRQRAEILADHLKRAAGLANNALWRGVAHQVDGLLTDDPPALRAAVRLLRTTSARPALADALHDLARSPGLPPAEAPGLLAECAAMYTRMGAGVAGDGTREPDGTTGDDARRPAVAALTPAEVRVAELLAVGMTKQEAARDLFVSFHTVDTHLRSIYAKLGVHNRVELALVWESRDEG